MKQSVRAKRMARHHKRLSAQGKLSLVSLMDIFTILVFFLMLNASDVQVLQTDRSLTLPKSTADTAAEEQLLLLVNRQQLVLEGQPIMRLTDVIADVDGNLEPLANELKLRSQLRQESANQSLNSDAQPSEVDGFAITIMGDHEIEYVALKKIMQTCAQQGYTNISLAVEYVEGEAEEQAVEVAI
jgi:biopolymer transport protein TolR